MSEPNHIIKRQILELQGVQEQDALELQSSFSQLFKDRILPLLDEYLTNYSPNGTRQRIESLTIDIGDIPHHNFEDIVVEKVKLQLHQYFQSASQPLEPSSASMEQPLNLKPIQESKAQIELLRFFVEKGGLPWWVLSDETDPISKSLDLFLENKTELLQQEIKRWIHRPNAIRRLVRHLKFNQLVQLANLKLRANPERLSTLISGLLEILELPTFSSTKRQEQLGIQFLSWVYLSPQASDTTGFWKAFFVQLASIEKTSFEQWLQKAKDKTAQLTNQTTFPVHPLVQLIEELKQEITIVPTGVLTPKPLINALKDLLDDKQLNTEEQGIAQNAISQLKKDNIPQEKILAWTKWLNKIQLRSVTPPPERLIKAFKDLLAKKQLSNEEQDMVKNAISQLGKDNIPQEKILAWTKWLNKIQLRSMTPPPERLIKAFKDLLTKKQLNKEEQDMVKNAISQLEKDNIPQEKILAWTKWLNKIQRGFSTKMELAKKEVSLAPNKFSESDEVFINNAGLVILWPFLERFFTRLGLVEDKKFIDDKAPHRAVGLLQYLADGQDHPMEYWCGLNKILCGMEINTLLDFGEALTANEASESVQFLEAVISNAPILNEMSVEGFRGSFLLRQAILKRGLGFWQLLAEKQPYDIVLERFPWQWKHIKLPWMKEGVQVEWV